MVSLMTTCMTSCWKRVRISCCRLMPAFALISGIRSYWNVTIAIRISTSISVIWRIAMIFMYSTLTAVVFAIFSRPPVISW